MSDDAWDADDFDPEAGFSKDTGAGGGDTWEGEDVGLVVEDKEEEVKQKSAAPKKTKQERINERKAKRREGEVKKQPQDAAALTAEEKLEEERKHEEAQRASDLESAMELFGSTVSGSSGQLERMNPQTPEEFEEFRQALTKKITQFETSTHYTAFVEGLIRSICAPLYTEDLRKLGSSLGVMANEKQKLKQPQSKKKKGKVGLSTGGKASRRADVDTYDDLGPDFDDFM